MAMTVLFVNDDRKANEKASTTARDGGVQGSEWWLCYFIHLLFVTNAYWYESVKPLQYYCSCLPVSIPLPMKKLLFWKKMLCSGNMILCRLAKCCNASIFALAAKFHLEPHDVVRSSITCIKDSFWFYFFKLV